MRPGPAAVIAGVVLYEVLVLAFFNRLSFDLIANVIQPLLIVGLIGVSAWAGLAVLGLVGLRNRLAVLFLVPFSSLIAGAMSSGGHPGLHGQVGLVMAIAPIAFTLQRPPWARSYALSVSTLLACAIVVGKVQHPSVWHNYQAQPMFVDRTIIDHPLYGPMIVDRRLNLFFDQACRTIRSSDAPAELLSMPYSYENYYCGIEPWGMHVQTYYDTTSAETITNIRRGLATNPPAWVLYQRQLQILRSNEISFNHGRPSEYRALDALIVDRVNRGAWTIALRWTERRGSEWFLIRTAAALRREEIPGPTPRRSPRGPSVPSR